MRCGRGEIEYFEGIHTKSCNVPELLKHDFFFFRIMIKVNEVVPEKGV